MRKKQRELVFFRRKPTRCEVQGLLHLCSCSLHGKMLRWLEEDVERILAIATTHYD